MLFWCAQTHLVTICDGGSERGGVSGGQQDRARDRMDIRSIHSPEAVRDSRARCVQCARRLQPHPSGPPDCGAWAHDTRLLQWTERGVRCGWICSCKRSGGMRGDFHSGGVKCHQRHSWCVQWESAHHLPRKWTELEWFWHQQNPSSYRWGFRFRPGVSVLQRSHLCPGSGLIYTLSIHS